LIIIQNLTNKNKSTPVRLPLKYPPATKALLEALLDELKENLFTESLLKSLNPITKYKLASVNKVFASAEKWNIK